MTALIPWENVLAYDVDAANMFMQRSGFMNRAMFHGMLRLGVKLDFIAGLLIKATEAAGCGTRSAASSAGGDAKRFTGLAEQCGREPPDSVTRQQRG